MKILGCVPFLVIATLAFPAGAIDCSRANTVQEKAICSNARLKAFDDYLTDAYANVRSVVPATLFDEVKKSQIDWIKRRDRTCGGNIACLMRETQLRTATLNGFVQSYVEELRQKLLGEYKSDEAVEEPSAAESNATPLNPKEIYTRAARSVVVVVAFNEGDGGMSQGSGVVIGNGVIATNCHVIARADDAVVLFKGEPYQVSSLRGNADIDYCIVYAPSLNAKPAKIASLDTVVPGQRVYSVGSPRGLNLTIAEGLVSGLREEDDIAYIQTTASISPGSSGGGLFDEFGRVIGITTFQIMDSQNLNFALPVELSKIVLD